MPKHKMEIIRGKVARPQRVVFYAIEGLGKTTLASQFPKPLFIDAEAGSDGLDVARLKVSNWRDVQKAVALAATSAEFRTVVLDTADGMETMLADNICDTEGVASIELVDGGFGKGYTRLADKWDEFLRGPLEKLIAGGKHVVLLVHAQAKAFTEPGQNIPYDRYELKMSKKGGPLTKGWCDELWFGNYKTVLVEERGKKTLAAGGKERLLFTSHTSAWDGKSRAGLPDRIPMTFEAVASVFGTSTFAAPIAPTQPSAVEPQDDIPMDHPVPVEPGDAPHALDELLGGKDQGKLTDFLVKWGEIQAGQTYRNVSASYASRILASKNSQAIFLQKAGL